MTRSVSPFVTITIGLLLSASTQADIINVPADQPTIQAGINAASDGDEIIVAPGTYVENINFDGKAITLRSTNPTDPAVVLSTIIDGGGSGTVVTCSSDEESDTVLSGFVITGGNALRGGGMYNEGSRPTVTNCTFSGNTANFGAMYNKFASPTVSNCTFSANSAQIAGGGMFNGSSSPTVSNCTFSANSAQFAGGGMNNGGGAGPFVRTARSAGIRRTSAVGYPAAAPACR